MGKFSESKKINLYSDNKFPKILDDFSLNIKKRRLTNEEIGILANIENKDPNIVRQKKIKERNEFRTKLLDKRKLKNNNQLLDENELVNNQNPILNPCEIEPLLNSVCADISVLSKLPSIATALSHQENEIPNFLPFQNQKDNKTKSKTVVDIFTEKANEIFLNRMLTKKNQETPKLLFNNNKEVNTLQFSSNQSSNIKNIEIVKPQEYQKDLNKEGCLGNQEFSTEKRLTFQNLYLQEFKFNSIIKETKISCSHPACIDLLESLKALSNSGEIVYSLIRRYLFFDMEMFVNKYLLNEGNIRQLCFLPKIYDRFLKECSTLQTVEKQANDSYDYNVDIQNRKWTILKTTMDSPNEVDFDLKYMCLKDENSLNDCSIINNNLNNNKKEINNIMNLYDTKQNDENSFINMEFSSFIKPIQNNTFRKNENGSSLTTRAKEFQKANKKLKNVMIASSNKELFKEDSINNSKINDSSLSFANNSDLPPWFKTNNRKVEKIIIMRSPLKQINRNIQD
ncbi:hypothetical protein HANVADRAFT_50986 [Hanseniaspora valbyensis NRRL Y-1626]|uniref:Uncharacterized protein n=1 Tax=Hanseniaspora valbyensis NRRL Y-1626 TaxID=766949 RepID=A0A1B7TJW9_9ASCO|nr:hypothetical protein HANVADRAFT_50986 [Hanseniaspora valbyensis NRRL Y-1626]